MTDYSKMSDFEINKAVAYHIGLRTVEMAEDGEFKPCNNPSDAWPIILSNLIALKPVKLYVGGHRWFASKGDGDFGLKFADDNPLRAAMIVYLMMKESENG
ncbi:phage protein NinX family protein [Hafnia paralvei]|uniref:phage protein NinX family protein n=1 Tax=Hafnia paralvei TaxID=546367 RepID=UPI00107DFC50